MRAAMVAGVCSRSVRMPILGGTLYEGTVELLPGTSCQGDGAHVVIRHDEAVCQCLQGIESGIEQNVCPGKLALYGIGKTEEQRVAGSEYNDGVVRRRLFEAGKYFFITGKDAVQRYGDGNPFGPGRQQRTDNLLMPYATGENLPLPYLRQCFRWKEGGTVVIHSYDYKSVFHSTGNLMKISSNIRGHNK